MGSDVVNEFECDQKIIVPITQRIGGLIMVANTSGRTGLQLNPIPTLLPIPRKIKWMTFGQRDGVDVFGAQAFAGSS